MTTRTRYWLRTEPRALLAWHGCTSEDAQRLRSTGWTEVDVSAFRVLLRGERNVTEVIQ